MNDAQPGSSRSRGGTRPARRGPAPSAGTPRYRQEGRVTPAPATRRESWVDNLRVVAIAAVVVVHTATAYVADFSDWYYDDELDATTVGSAAVGLPALLGAIFGLGPLFLLAGWFSVGSLARRGPGRFASARAVRLGLPLLAYLLLVNPLADLVGNLWQEDRSFASYLGDTELSVMWFVAALLACSLGYAAVRGLHVAPQRRRAGPTAALVGAATIAAVSVLVWPTTSLLDGHLMSLRLGAWTQGLVLFALGVLAGEAGWDGRMTLRAERRWGLVAAAGLTLVSLMVALAPSGDLNQVFHDMSWQGVAFAALYGLVSVAFSVWCVAWVRRHWVCRGPLLDRAGRASYATFLVHPLVLTTVMVSLRWLAVPAEPKFLVVTVLAVPTCFACGYALTRVPGLRRVI
jgi:peptidoglycan/LPS O-acetylase OafA/YrhL